LTRTFADTFFLLALFNSRDAAHERAVAESKALQGILVTTDWVLVETADALCDRKNRVKCAKFINDLRRSGQVEIQPA
jgi:predicted nucleic acid-binding protein